MGKRFTCDSVSGCLAPSRARQPAIVKREGNSSHLTVKIRRRSFRMCPVVANLFQNAMIEECLIHPFLLAIYPFLTICSTSPPPLSIGPAYCSAFAPRPSNPPPSILPLKKSRITNGLGCFVQDAVSRPSSLINGIRRRHFYCSSD